MRVSPIRRTSVSSGFWNPASTTSPTNRVWSPQSTSWRTSHSTNATASRRTGTPVLPSRKGISLKVWACSSTITGLVNLRTTARSSRSTTLTLNPGPLQVIREHDGHRIASSPTHDRGGVMSAADEAVVRRFYEEMNNGRKLELAPELFATDHKMHDPQVPGGEGPDGMVAVVKTYQ